MYVNKFTVVAFFLLSAQFFFLVIFAVLSAKWMHHTEKAQALQELRETKVAVLFGMMISWLGGAWIVFTKTSPVEGVFWTNLALYIGCGLGSFPFPDVVRWLRHRTLDPYFNRPSPIVALPPEHGVPETSDWGTTKWYYNRQLHRDNGPAIETKDGYQAWYQLGMRHRLNGPAEVFPDGTQIWWNEGICLNPAQRPMNLSTDSIL